MSKEGDGVYPKVPIGSYPEFDRPIEKDPLGQGIFSFLVGGYLTGVAEGPKTVGHGIAHAIKELGVSTIEMLYEVFKEDLGDSWESGTPSGRVDGATDDPSPKVASWEGQDKSRSYSEQNSSSSQEDSRAGAGEAKAEANDQKNSGSDGKEHHGPTVTDEPPIINPDEGGDERDPGDDPSPGVTDKPSRAPMYIDPRLVEYLISINNPHGVPDDGSGDPRMIGAYRTAQAIQRAIRAGRIHVSPSDRLIVALTMLRISQDIRHNSSV